MNELSHQYGTYEKQERLLIMIKDVDCFLRTNDIKYSLCGGTLLGAVREKGFIPWDDDIDIMVDRNNYNKIVELFKNRGGGTDYVLNHYLWVDRIQRKGDTRTGLYADTIDVFVLDNCPDNRVLGSIKVLLIKILQGMMKEEIHYNEFALPYKICLWLTHNIGKLFKSESKFRYYHMVAQLGNSKTTSYLTMYTNVFKSLSIRDSKYLFESILLQPFEDIKLPITKEYDSYLRAHYGDYLTLPKEEDRYPIHMDNIL